MKSSLDVSQDVRSEGVGKVLKCQLGASPANVELLNAKLQLCKDCLNGRGLKVKKVKNKSFIQWHMMSVQIAARATGDSVPEVLELPEPEEGRHVVLAGRHWPESQSQEELVLEVVWIA